MINRERLLKNLKDIGEIGRVEGKGISRLAFSKEYFQALEKLEALALDKGFTTRIDSLGNLFIEYNPSNKEKYFMIGSHLDTVKNGGLYDGALGIFSGFEVLETLKENKVYLEFGLILACFNAEEGSEMGGTFGSRSITSRTNYQDQSLPEKLGTYNLTLDDIRDSEIDLSKIIGFIELHIEQGSVLYKEGLDIGVVNGIVGISRKDLIIKGQANHAGTTPMAYRDDPVKKLSRVLDILYKVAGKYLHPFVMTVGNIVSKPGMYNIIPAQLKLMIEVRDMEQENIDEFFLEIENLIREEGINYDLVQNIFKAPVKLDEGLVEVISQESLNLGYKSKILSSGAGHDSSEMSHVLPTGMVFVPSVDGISHSPEEETREEDIEKGTRVLYNSILELLRKYK